MSTLMNTCWFCGEQKDELPYRAGSNPVCATCGGMLIKTVSWIDGQQLSKVKVNGSPKKGKSTSSSSEFTIREFRLWILRQDSENTSFCGVRVARWMRKECWTIASAYCELKAVVRNLPKISIADKHLLYELCDLRAEYEMACFVCAFVDMDRT